jgi:lipopolysaccharide export system ATP-binding protein
VTLLTAHGLTRRFGKRTVVNNVSLCIEAGQVHGLLGPNGAGKTTLFRMLTGLLRPHGGRVELAGVDVTRWPLWRRARAGLGYLPQGASVFRHLTVRQNVLAGLRHRPRGARYAEAEALLARFALSDLADARADRLSGGERRRVEIVRALAADPRVLLVDEPFAGLDPIAAQGVRAHLQTLAGAGVAVLITDHRVRQAFKACTRVDIIDAGAILFSGTPAQAACDPEVCRRYLGDGGHDADGASPD